MENQYLLVAGSSGGMATELTEEDHENWLNGPLDVYHCAPDGRLFVLTTCDPFCYPGCWEWALA